MVCSWLVITRVQDEYRMTFLSLGLYSLPGKFSAHLAGLAERLGMGQALFQAPAVSLEASKLAVML